MQKVQELLSRYKPVIISAEVLLVSRLYLRWTFIFWSDSVILARFWSFWPDSCHSGPIPSFLVITGPDSVLPGDNRARNHPVLRVTRARNHPVLRVTRTRLPCLGVLPCPDYPAWVYYPALYTTLYHPGYTS